ncbi:MAG: hypothetical protein Q9180_004894 [Flavoplaca navasiana]
MRISLLPFLAILNNIAHAQSPPDLSSIAQVDCLEDFTAERTTCTTAIINGFPNNISVNQFHSGEPANFYQLPRTAIAGSDANSQCRVTVDLNVATPVETSWHYVWTMASMLMDACTPSPISIPSSPLPQALQLELAAIATMILTSLAAVVLNANALGAIDFTAVPLNTLVYAAVFFTAQALIIAIASNSIIAIRFGIIISPRYYQRMLIWNSKNASR